MVMSGGEMLDGLFEEVLLMMAMMLMRIMTILSSGGHRFL